MGVATTVMVITATALLAASARADDSLLAAQSRIARDAAAHGHCDVVAQVAAQVAQTDHTYYTTTFLGDPTLGYCLGVPGARPPPPKVEQPVTTTTRTLEGTPPLDAERVAGEVLLGGTAATVGGIVGVIAGFGIALGCKGNGCDEVVLGGGLVGITAGASFGVCAVGSHDHERGSCGASVAAAAVGTLAGVGIATHLDSNGLRLVTVVAAPVVSATLLYNITRRYDVVPVPTSHGLALAGTF